MKKLRIYFRWKFMDFSFHLPILKITTKPKEEEYRWTGSGGGHRSHPD